MTGENRNDDPVFHSTVYIFINPGNSCRSSGFNIKTHFSNFLKCCFNFTIIHNKDIAGRFSNCLNNLATPHWFCNGNSLGDAGAIGRR